MIDASKIRSYFEIRFDGQRLPMKNEVALKCLFHEDRSASLSLNLEKGAFYCHAGCGKGGMIAFEMLFSKCDEATAKANISDLLGGSKLFATGQKPEAVYPYLDAYGRLLFEKVRMPGKRFMQRRPDGKGGYEYKLGEIAKPLYRLPEVLVSNDIAICEGEKDCDNVRALGLSDRDKGIFFTATTNFDGAGKWRDSYSPYFAGKRVVIFPDNDDTGRNHAEQVARSIFPYAAGVKIVALPGLPEKGDVSDFLKDHTAADVLSEIKRAPQWKPAKSESKLLADASEFMSAAPEKIDWVLDGIIERGANGFFVAVPKGGKSWAAADMMISLALGVPWLGFEVSRPVRCALVSREDNPAMTAWRLRHLFPSKGGSIDILRENLFVNSRKQSAELMLDNPEQVAELIAEFTARKIEFAVFDVLNVLHTADENNNTEMRNVLRQLTLIQAQVGCSIGVVHHFNKAETGGLTQRMRGASAIAGWAEWLIGITMADEDTKTRRMEFELKAAQPPEPIYYRIESDAGGCTSLVRTQQEARPIASNSSRAARLMQ